MADYYTVLTYKGAEKIADFLAGGPRINLVAIAVGDGGGADFYDEYDRQTLRGRTSLINQRWTDELYLVEKDPDNPAWVITEGRIPVDDGGWYIREVGIFDAVGDLIAIGVYPETYKPVLDTSIGTDLTIRSIIEVRDADSVIITIDPSVVQATREWVDQHKVDKSQIGPELDQLKTPDILREGVGIVPGRGVVQKYEHLPVGYVDQGLSNNTAFCLLLMQYSSSRSANGGYLCGEFRFSQRFQSKTSQYNSSTYHILVEQRDGGWSHNHYAAWGQGIRHSRLGLVWLTGDSTPWLALINTGPKNNANSLGHGGFYGLSYSLTGVRENNLKWKTADDLVQEDDGNGNMVPKVEEQDWASSGTRFFGRPGDQIGNNTAWHSGNTIADAEGYIKEA